MIEATISNDALRRHLAARETSGRPFTYSAAAAIVSEYDSSRGFSTLIINEALLFLLHSTILCLCVPQMVQIQLLGHGDQYYRGFLPNIGYFVGNDGIPAE